LPFPSLTLAVTHSKDKEELAYKLEIIVLFRANESHYGVKPENGKRYPKQS